MLKFYAVQSEKGALDEFPFLRWLSLQPVVVGLGEYKINAFSVWLPYKCCAAENYLMNVRYGRRSQPVDATHSANFSAGVWYCKVLRGGRTSTARADIQTTQYLLKCTSGVRQPLT